MLAKDYFQGFRHEMVDVGDGIRINTVVGGQGKEAILLLHGHPETYIMWRFIAPQLAEKYTVVATDLRGYGDSSKPQGLPDHSNYSKRAMADDQVAVMAKLGFSRYHVAGHDRGARVCHRLIMDHPEKVASCTLLDILPTYDMYRDTNQEFATKYWHWFFYIQPDGLPEKLLSADPDFFIHFNLQRKIGPKARHRFPEDVLQEYTRCFADPKTLHGISEDYRASATSTCNTICRTGKKSSRPRCSYSGAPTASSAACGTSWPAGRNAPPMSADSPCRTAVTSCRKNNRKSSCRPCRIF